MYLKKHAWWKTLLYSVKIEQNDITFAKFRIFIWCIFAICTSVTHHVLKDAVRTIRTLGNQGSYSLVRFFLFLFVPLHVDFSNGRIYFGCICEIREKLHLAKITLYTVFLNLWMEEQEKCVINYVSFLTLKRRDFRIIHKSGTTIYFTIFLFVLA